MRREVCHLTTPRKIYAMFVGSIFSMFGSTTTTSTCWVHHLFMLGPPPLHVGSTTSTCWVHHIYMLGPPHLHVWSALSPSLRCNHTRYQCLVHHLRDWNHYIPSAQHLSLDDVEVRCGGLVVSVPATRSTRPGFKSRPGASPQSGLRGGKSLCEYCTNRVINISPWLAVSQKKKIF